MRNPNVVIQNSTPGINIRLTGFRMLDQKAISFLFVVITFPKDVFDGLTVMISACHTGSFLGKKPTMRGRPGFDSPSERVTFSLSSCSEFLFCTLPAWSRGRKEGEGRVGKVEGRMRWVESNCSFALEDGRVFFLSKSDKERL